MPSIRGGWNAQRTLAAIALTLGLLAMIAGDPDGAPPGGVDVAALARMVEQEQDHVSAIELARMIRDRTPALRVIDLRSAEAFDAYRIPGAERMSLSSLARERFDRDETVVLYSEGGADAARGWAILQTRGHGRVYFLRGGVFEWIDEVMEARIASDAGESERAAFREVAELSRHFGGQPTISDRPRSVLDAIAIPAPRDSIGAAAKSAKEAVRRLERRGC